MRLSLHSWVCNDCWFQFVSVSTSYCCYLALTSPSMNILLVDMYPGKPASATAANNLLRCWLGAGSTALVVPLINAVGIGWAATIAAGIWVGYTPVLLLIMKKGPRWRREAREAMAKK